MVARKQQQPSMNTKQRKARRPQIVTIAMRHRKIFAEVFKGQLERDFFELGADKKPAVLAEVHFEHSVFDTYEEFLSELNAFMSEAAGAKYWVFIGESEPFFFDLYICKLRSVGIALKAANTIPTDYHAGAVGLLLGYPYPKVVEYAKRNAPIEFR